MPQVLSILFGALFTGAVAWALGRLLLARLRLKLYREEEHLLAFVAGACLYGLLLFVLCALHVVYDATLLIAGLAILGLAWRARVLNPRSPMLPPLPRFWRVFFLAGYLPCAFVCLVWAIKPEISPDGATYHLGIMERYYYAHGFTPFPQHMYAMLSQGVDLLFMNAFAFGRQSAAALTHCLFLLALPVLILSYARRSGVPEAGAGAALLVFLAPVAMVAGASAYNDLAVTAILFSVFYVVEIAREEPGAPAAILAGVLSGGACAAKYTAFLAFPVAFVGLGIALFRRRRAAWKPLLVLCLVAAVFVVPWLARNVIYYQNPVAPLLNKYFPNPYIHVSFEDDYTHIMRKYQGLASYRDLPYELCLHGAHLAGTIGPVFLLLPLGLPALRTALGRRLLLVGLVYALPYATNVGARFMLPALPFFALAIALAPPRRLAVVVLPLLAVLQGYDSVPRQKPKWMIDWAWRIHCVPWRAALRLVPEPVYLSTHLPPYNAARLLERATPQGSVILTTTNIAEGYTRRETWVDFQSAIGQRLRDGMQCQVFQDNQPVEQKDFQFPEQPLTAVRLVQTAPKGPENLWSIAEFRVLDRGRELPRDPAWRVTARPFPWDVQRAFDNEPDTRWRSWQSIEPGMYVELRFPAPTLLSTVRVEASVDQWAVKLRLDGRTPSGVWKTLTGQYVSTGLSPPLNMRCAATRDMLRAGVTHFLINEDDYAWKDVHEKPDLWGMTEIGDAAGDHLFRLEKTCPITSSASTEASPPPRP
jgi:hypothetical protein